MAKVCITCATFETSRWRTGPTCTACYLKSWREKNKEHCSNYIKQNHAKRLKVARDWKRANPERARYHRKLFNIRHPEIRNKHTQAYKDAKRRAQPPWASNREIAEFYNNRPEGHYVDHIVPLRGKNVCGLHVIWNLQYLPSLENSIKSNKFSP